VIAILRSIAGQLVAIEIKLAAIGRIDLLSDVASVRHEIHEIQRIAEIATAEIADRRMRDTNKEDPRS